MLLVTESSLAGIGSHDVVAEYTRRRLDTWSDRRLAAAVAAVVALPTVAPADSFQLHAPLELLARLGLLSYVEAARREQARHRLVWLAATYASSGTLLGDPPAPDSSATSLRDVATRLVAALEAGDLDDVDRHGSFVAAHATHVQLRHLLGPAIVSSLAAAAHGSILLNLLPRVAPAGDITGTIARGPLRELARQPGWKLRWFDDPMDAVLASSPSRQLADALVDVPMLGSPGSDFIYPTMMQAEQSGVAPRLLAGVLRAEPVVVETRRALARVAAWSMLQEPPDHAPYGWSHCLTMPQGVMGLAADGVSPTTATAVAATYVVGFRAAAGTRSIDPCWTPVPATARSFSDAIDAGPHEAAAWAWHAPRDARHALVTELATRASLHHDAHLVKYTLACLDAAGDDAGNTHLYLASAAYLSAWWAQQPADGFFDR